MVRGESEFTVQFMEPEGSSVCCCGKGPMYSLRIQKNWFIKNSSLVTQHGGT